MRTRSILILLVVAACAAPFFAGGAECQKKAAQAASASKSCEMTAAECQKWLAEAKTRPWLGVDLNVDKTADTVTVEHVVADSPAKRAGFRVGDQLVALNGVSYGRAHEKKLAATMNGLKEGETVTYTVRRNGAEQKLSATLSRMPDSVYLAMVDQHKKEHAEVASR